MAWMFDGRPADHALGLGADGERAPVLHVDGDDRRLVEDDAATPDVDERVRGPEVDGHVAAEQREAVVCHMMRPFGAPPPAHLLAQRTGGPRK